MAYIEQSKNEEYIDVSLTNDEIKNLIEWREMGFDIENDSWIGIMRTLEYTDYIWVDVTGEIGINAPALMDEFYQWEDENGPFEEPVAVGNIYFYPQYLTKPLGECLIRGETVRFIRLEKD